MADKRKLQGEIDRCLKKVSEGVETFEDIWQKVHSATNANQKEKYESDLKKEIKKLQRLRDQIKSWLQSNDIKDKRQLQENRKTIETQMERFKVVERETKTKAYSKEGLQGFASKVDPAQKEREELRGWLSESIDSLNRQVEQFESEMEVLNVGTKRKRGDKDKQERLDGLLAQMERHDYHVVKLETVMRMLDNDSIDIDVVKNLKDGVAYYIDSNQDPDFQEDEYLYDDLELDEQMMGQPILASPHHNNVDEDWEAGLVGRVSPINSFPMSPTQKGFFKIDEDKKKGSKSEVIVNDVHVPKKKTVSTSSSQSSITSVTTPVKANSTSGGSSNKAVVTPSTKAPIIVTASPMKQTTGSNSSVTSVTQDGKVAGPASGTSYSAAASVSQPQPQLQQQQLAHQQSPQLPSSLSKQLAKTPSSKESTSTSLSQPSELLPDLSEPSATVITTTATVASTSATTMANSVETVNSRLSPEEVASTISSESLSSASFGGDGGLSQDSPVFTPVTSASVTPPLLIANQLADLYLSQPTCLNSLTIASDTLARNTDSMPATSSAMPIAIRPVERVEENIPQKETENWPLGSLKSIAAHAVAQAGLDKDKEEEAPVRTVPEARDLVDNVSSLVLTALTAATATTTTTTTTTLQEPVLMQPLDPVLGAAPLGRVRLTKERSTQLAMLDGVCQHLPLAADSERVRPHLPRNPYPTQQHHHAHPPAHFDSFDFFQRLNPETLFFIFYYQEGTRAQYLAAKALKKQAWRFHTKYLMWFQRHEEPKTITDEYEQGTYIYFDYEKWQQRKKEGFTFEYRFLEDMDLP